MNLGSLENLRRFVAVTEQGTMHKAAALLGVTQPALTHSIQNLEKSVGAALFERRARGVHLTSMGQRVLQHAKHILRECQLAEADIESLKQGETGTLRIAGAPVWMSTILPYTIARMHEQHPNLKIQCASYNYSDALVQLQDGSLDLFCGGFQRREQPPSFLMRRAMFSIGLEVIARQNHPIFTQDAPDAHDLLRYPWLSYQSDVAYLDMAMDEIFDRTGERREASVQVESMLTALALLRQGNYLAFLPSSFVSSSFGTGLSTVATDLTKVTFESGVIYRRSLRANAALRSFLAAAETRIRANEFDVLNN